MMKRLIVVAMMVAATAAAFAGNDDPKMTVVAFQGTDVYKVIYKGSESAKVRLNILNANGGVLHTEMITGLEGFIRPLNFKGLTSGQYTIEVIDGGERYVKQIAHKPAADPKAIHVSKIMAEPGKYLLAVAHAQNEPIRIRIYDERSRLVHEESRVIAGDFAQVYNFKDTFGRYSFEVVDQRGKSKYFWF